MIAKAVKGRGFRGALAYDLGKDDGRILDTNMAGESIRELSAEFGAIRKLRPNLERAVLHVSLSAAPGENPSHRHPARPYIRSPTIYSTSRSPVL